MNEEDREKLLEERLWGDPPRELFRAQALLDSTAAFIRARQRYARWRFAVLGAAGVLIAGVAFLLGRCSVLAGKSQLMPVPLVAEGPTTATVPDEVIAWLEAAQLFRQLGMEERMARAVDRASRLLPRDATPVGCEVGQILAAGADEKKRMDAPEVHPSAEHLNRILAQSLGD